MLSVEQQDHEDLVFASGERQAQVVADRARRGQRVARRHLLLESAACQLQRGLQLRELGAAQTGYFPEPRGSRLEQGRDRAETPEKLPRQVHRAHSLHAGAKQDREQLGVGEGGGTLGEQALARPLLQRPV